MFGFIINGVQASVLEHNLVKNGNWNGATGMDYPKIGWISTHLTVASRFAPGIYSWFVAFLVQHAAEAYISSAMLILYTVQPILYRLASSTYFNLSLLSRNFYGLLFGKWFP
jgi:solute carrier family 35 protein F1/2